VDSFFYRGGGFAMDELGDEVDYSDDPVDHISVFKTDGITDGMIILG